MMAPQFKASAAMPEDLSSNLQLKEIVDSHSCPNISICTTRQAHTHIQYKISKTAKF